MIFVVLKYIAFFAIFYWVMHLISILGVYTQWWENCNNHSDTKLYLTWKEFITAFPYMKSSFSCYSNFLEANFNEKELIFYTNGQNESQIVIFSFIDFIRFKHWERINVKNLERNIAQKEKEQNIQTTLEFLKEAQKATAVAAAQCEGI